MIHRRYPAKPLRPVSRHGNMRNMNSELLLLIFASLKALVSAIADQKTAAEVASIADSAQKALDAWESTQGPLTKAQLDALRVSVPWPTGPGQVSPNAGNGAGAAKAPAAPAPLSSPTDDNAHA